MAISAGYRRHVPIGSWENQEFVTLILENRRFNVKKNLLNEKSQYFHLLFSTDYKDCDMKKYYIRYAIPHSTFQDFIKWICDDKYFVMPTGRQLKSSLRKFRNGDLKDLLQLLHLSVLFAADPLIEDIIDLIEIYWLHPKYVIDIWLVAQDLGLHLLRDISLAACLDRFEKLPIQRLLSLKRNKFKKLVGNINVRSKEDYLQYIMYRWINFNDQRVSISEIKREEPKFLHCIILQGNTENSNSKIRLYCCDGNDFFEHSAFEYPKEIAGKPRLRGMQFFGRGYNLYLCGGEYGGDTGRFNVKVWRYSLLSKKWFYESSMPVPRRDMIAAVLHDKLLLVAGTGPNRIPISRVDIYDMHTKIWTKGMDLSEDICLPEYITVNGNLIIYTVHRKQFILYMLDENMWYSLNFQLPYVDQPERIPLIMHDVESCYLEFSHRSKPTGIVRSTIRNSARCTNSNICKRYKLIGFPHPFNKNCDMFYYTRLPGDNNYVVILSTYKPCELHLHSLPVKDSERFRTKYALPMRMFFRIIDPADLHNTLNIFGNRINR